MTEREALKLALEALQKIYIAPEHEEYIRVWWPACEQAITAIKEALAQTEPVAWPCVIAEADFSENTITLIMQCTDYKVSAGKHWLSTTPPQRTWVGLTKAQCGVLWKTNMTPFEYYQAIEDKLKEKNT